MAGDEADLVADPQTVGGGGDGEAAVLVRGALVGRGGLVVDERWPRIEGERLQTGVDDRAVLGRASSKGLRLTGGTSRMRVIG